uniref:Secreted protein n=1 Tax=Haemonchus contortus TaxID=6289 RepID=A0A7I4YHJ2_HAECO
MMTSSIYPLIALLVVVRLSYQETVENDNFLRPRRNFFMSSGPSQARVMELERIVNTIVPRQSRNVQPSSDDVEQRPNRAVEKSLLGSTAPCFCPAFARCIGNCHRIFRYW